MTQFDSYAVYNTQRVKNGKTKGSGSFMGRNLGRFFPLGVTQFHGYAIYHAERGIIGRQKVSGLSYDAS